MRHICKTGKLEIRAVIKYFFEKGMPPKEIHEDLMEALEKKQLKRQQSLKWGRESVEDNGRSSHPNMPPMMKMSRSCTPCLCVIGGETCEE